VSLESGLDKLGPRQSRRSHGAASGQGICADNRITCSHTERRQVSQGLPKSHEFPEQPFGPPQQNNEAVNLRVHLIDRQSGKAREVLPDLTS